MTVSAPTEPGAGPRARTWVAASAAALCVGGCSGINALNALSDTDVSTTVSGVAYGSDPRQVLDVYVPTQHAAPYPVLLFFFGGSWNSGDRADYRFVGEALAAKGILAVVADYRLYPQVRYPSFVQDSARAARWTLDNVAMYGGDAQRVFVMGHSAGAYNAAMIALDPRWMAAEGTSNRRFAGFIGLAGPYDFLPIENEDVKPVFFFPDSPPDSQPIRYAGSESPRSFLAAGVSDRLVDPERNSHQLADKLSAAGIHVTYRRYAYVGHVTLVAAIARPLRWLAPVLDDIDAFIRTPMQH